jgi:acylpyruvate hydrolase
MIAQGADLLRTGRDLLPMHAIDLNAVRILPPVPKPPKILCVGLNYDDHLEESGLKKPVYPEIFARFATSLIAHGDPILQPPESSALDYEAELAVVIGRGGRRISRDSALDHVAGYSLFNDATIRDFQLRTPQWTMGKNFDATGAFGPWLVTPDALPPGAHGLRIQGRLNGRVMQDTSTDRLIFNVSALIELISVVISLEAGDVIITGTPGGVGAARKPPVFMQRDDVFEVEIEGMGVLSNPVQRESQEEPPR